MISYKEILTRVFDRSHLRRNLIVGVGLITLLLVVLFSPAIQNLLNKPFGSRASIDEDDLQKIWESIERDGGTKAVHSKMIMLEEDGRAWIYVAGGARVADNVIEGRKITEVLKTVKRLEVDPVLGKPLEASNWEAVPDFNFGRQEFGFVVQGDYLYAIAGDMHYPPSGSFNPETESPLIYSTIERIKIDTIGTPGAKWEVFSKLSGVNYYPEVAATTNGIHVVGGVYGYPFPPLTSDAGLADNIMGDVVNTDGDTKWNVAIGTGGQAVANLPTIGKPGLTIPRGSINSPILEGGGIANPPSDGGTGGTGTGGAGNPGPQEGILMSGISPQVLSDVTVQNHNGTKIEFVGMKSEYVLGKNAGVAIRAYGTSSDMDSAIFYWRPSPDSPEWYVLGSDHNGEYDFAEHYKSFGAIGSLDTSTETTNAQFRVVVSDFDSNWRMEEVSPTFAIVYHNLALTSPRGTDVLTGGGSHTIRWNSIGVAPNKTVYIEYTTDGTTWQPAATTQNTGEYSWGVPNVASTQARVRIKLNSRDPEADLDAWAQSQPFVIQGGGIPSDKLSEALVSGEFVTTVGEHYFISIINNNYNASSTRIGELASDYNSGPGLSTRWEIGKVGAIGHLRFLVLSDASVVPVPQGRYGHKLIFSNNSYYVFGGASWAKELSIKRAAANFVEHFKTFWVIDNANHPVYRDHNFEFKYGKDTYEYIGNIAYRWDGSKWIGVNGAGTKNYSGQTLSSGYSFKLYDGGTALANRGRAFYGLASTNLGTLVASAGLQNQTKTTPGLFGGPDSVSDFEILGGYFRIHVGPVDTSEVFNGNDWTQEESYKEAVYNITSSSLNGGGLFYSGQKVFQTPLGNSQTVDPHVPDYTQPFSAASYIYKPADEQTVTRWFAHPTPDMKEVPALFAATTSGNFGSGNNLLVMAYHYGGFDSETLQFIGPFGNEPDPKDQRIATLTLSPTIIAPDDADYSIATVTLKNGLGEPVYQHNGETWQVTLSSNRGPNGDFTIVDNMGGYKPGKLERGVAYLSEEVPQYKEFVYLDEQGTARFKVYSNTATPAGSPAKLEPLFQTTSIGQKFPASADLTVAYQPGVPSHRLSTIVGDPNPVAADNTTYSLVTVTLKDYTGEAIVGYHVKITSDRNAESPDDPIDTITNDSPGSFITNSLGQAKFRVKSAIKGNALIRAYFGATPQELQSNPRELTPNLLLKFQGFISGLVPDSARQGQKLPSMVATGSQANWIPSVTKVAFAKPQAIDFDRTSGVILRAGGSSSAPVKYAIVAPQHKGKQVTLTISPDKARFSPEGTTSVTRTLDSNGRAIFFIQAGVTSGLMKVTAQIGGIAGPSAELSLMLVYAGVHAYDIDMYAHPSILDTPNASTTVRAGLYRYVNGVRTLITTPTEFQFYKDDLGTFDPSNGKVTTQQGNGVASLGYTRDGKSGTVRIIAMVVVNGRTYAEVIEVHKVSNDEGITFNPNYVLGGNPQGEQTLTIPSTSDNEVDAVVISDTAEVGVWSFVTSTEVGPDETETYSYPFTVLPIDYIGGARIVDITPTQGFRGTQNVSMTIKGSETNFTSSSNVIFKSLDGSSAGITVVPGSKSAPDPETLTLKVNIASDATAGFWNITVVTPDVDGEQDEVAELNGASDADFLVTTPSNVIVDVVPSPMVIPRDGRAKSTITAFVGKLDPLSGKIVPLPNVVVTFAFVGADGGKLDPLDDGPGQKGRKTNAQGIATTVYTTDAGSEDDEAKISATVTVDGVVVSNSGFVIKKINLHNNVVLTATPDSLPLTGGTSNLEVIVKDSKGNFARPGTRVEFIFAGPGGIVPLVTQVQGSGGRATATYSVGVQQLAQTVHIFAKATIDGDGVVYSNEALVSIGLDSSKYQVTITANPTSITAGGTQASTLTAKIVFRENGDTPVANWPVTFAISRGDVGDYLTLLSGKTNANGELTTKLFPGLIAGTVAVFAQPMALPWAEVEVTKTADQTISAALSTISAVPKYIPADDTAFTVISVTLRNSRNVAIPGKTVTLTSSVGTIFPSATATTDFRGIAKFNIKSATTGTANISAQADNVTLNTTAVFVPEGTLVPVDLSVIVPLEAKSYDRLVRLFLRQPANGELPVIDEVYETDITDHVLDLPTVYLKPATEYKFWAKGKYHLARIKPVTATSRNIEVNFMGMYKNRNIGLPIGDIAPDEGGSAQGLFHDNAINAVDFATLSLNWFKNSYVADFTSDGLVNILEYVYWVNNYGSGDPLP